MVLSRRVARLNRRLTNRLLGPLAAATPGFGVVEHRGRRTGARYRTPVNVFRTPSGFSIALTYGSTADWVRNVVAAGGCRLVTGRRVHVLESPVLVRDPARADVPAVVRVALRAIGAEEFLRLTAAGPGAPRQASPG